MKKRWIAVSLILIFAMFLLQGCSTEGETSIKVVVSENGKRVEAELKADQAKNYKWSYFTKNGNITESASDFKENIFNNTATQKYAFVIDERDTDTLYFVLYETDDIDSGKIYEYVMSYDDEGNILLSDMKESSLINNQSLLEKVKAQQ